MKRALLDMRWTIVLSVLTGVLLSYVIKPWALYDMIFPIVSMEAQVVQKNPAEVIVKLTGSRNRGNCLYLGPQAYTEVGKRLSDLYMDRIDKPADGKSRPVGDFDFGVWRIWPTEKTRNLVIYMTYNCSGRYVEVRAVEMAL